MPFIFKDADDRIEFEYCDSLPDEAVKLGKEGRFNITALHLYSLYRNSLHDSYVKKPDVAADILARQPEYKESVASLLTNPIQKSALYHYTVGTAVGALKEWQDPEQKMKGFLAYEKIDGRRTLIGFVDFNEHVVNHKRKSP